MRYHGEYILKSVDVSRYIYKATRGLICISTNQLKQQRWRHKQGIKQRYFIPYVPNGVGRTPGYRLSDIDAFIKGYKQRNKVKLDTNKEIG